MIAVPARLLARREQGCALGFSGVVKHAGLVARKLGHLEGNHIPGGWWWGSEEGVGCWIDRKEVVCGKEGAKPPGGEWLTVRKERLMGHLRVSATRYAVTTALRTAPYTWQADLECDAHMQTRQPYSTTFNHTCCPATRPSPPAHVLLGVQGSHMQR